MLRLEVIEALAARIASRRRALPEHRAPTERARALVEQEGQVLALVGLLMGVILFGLGLAVDVGQLFSARRAAQIAADAGAWAGAVRLYNAGSAAQAIAAATTDTTRNGFSTGAPAGTTVTVTSPPSAGAFSGNASYVQVVVTQTVGTAFLGAVRALTTVTTTAVAWVQNCGGTTDGVLVLEGGNVSGALNLNNASTKLTASGSGIQVNSTSATAVTLNSGGVDLTATSIKIVGNTSDGAEMSPAPATGAASESDPLACVAKPDLASMVTRAAVASDYNNTNATLNPGIYVGGIRARGSSAITLNPGVYVMKGSGGTSYGLTTSGTASISGSGVMIYNVNGSFPASGGTCTALSMAATGTVNLTAQRTGSYAGILLWQDALCATSGTLTMTGSWSNFEGTVYLPGAATRLTLVLSSDVSLRTQLVVKRLQLNNNHLLTLVYDAAKVYRRFPALAE